MNEKMSRNEPCPCGSGKKYKKCCGLREVASITKVIEREIDELQHQLLQYALFHFENELDDDFEDFLEMLEQTDEEEERFYLLLHTIWFSVFVKMDDGETILEKFIRDEAKKIKRPKTKEIFLSWQQGARTIAGKILRLEANTLTFEDVLNGGESEAIVISDLPEIKEGEFFTGILLPYDQKYVFFPIPYSLENLSPQRAEVFILDSSRNAGYDSTQEFLTDHLLELMSELPAIHVSVHPDDLDWPAPVYKETADLFQHMMETGRAPQDITELGIIMWYQFCKVSKKRIQNPSLYAAAIHYLAYNTAMLSRVVTQKEIAEQYGIAPGRISAISRDIMDVLEEQMEESDSSMPGMKQVLPQAMSPLATEQEFQKLLAELNQHEFKDMEEVNAFIGTHLNNSQTAVKKTTGRSKKEEAQDLIYEALEAVGKKRYKLAQEALQLNPNHADGYNILAEKATSLEEAARLYKQGMDGGQKELGKAFIMENKGHFWGLFETRPYMRAKKNYADTLILMGRREEGIREYEDLLALNPNDNQGARDGLFIAYMDGNDFKSAKRLLEQYKEETTQGILNSLLLELSEKGFTPKATSLLKKAKKQNKFVVAYLTDKKKLPKQLPDYYGFGDENEAIIYAFAYQHLWGKIDGLKDWLK